MATLLAVLAAALTAGATLAGPGRANGHGGQSTLKLTPASAFADGVPNKQCDGKPCVKIAFSAGYVYTPDAGSRRCPESLALTWDGAVVGTSTLDASHGSCTATLRRDLQGVDAAKGALAVGAHTVCANVSGGPPTTSGTTCAVFTILLRPAPSARPSPTPQDDAVHPTPPPARPSGHPAENAVNPPPSPIPVASAPDALPAPSDAAPSQPDAIPAPSSAASPSSQGGAVIEPAPTPPATPAAISLEDATKGGGNDTSLLVALVCLVFGLAVLDVAYVAATARSMGRFR